MSVYTQESRTLSVETPLGDDVLLLTSFHGREELSELFSFRLAMLSTNTALGARDLVGKKVTFSLKTGDGEVRHFNGFVKRFTAGGLDPQGLRNYSAEVAPWLWFLRRRSDCRIFQNKTVVEIIQQVFEHVGFEDFDFSQVKDSHPRWDFCVQYRETDFAFVSRLMEKEGIFYRFRHEHGRHTMILGDNRGAYRPAPEQQVDYSDGSLTTNHVYEWTHDYEFRSGKWSHADYNFEKPLNHLPKNNLLSEENTVIDLPGIDKFEMYEYPGSYSDLEVGRWQCKIRMEEDEVSHDRIHGSSNCISFAAGECFALKNHPCESENSVERLVIAIEHHAVEQAHYSNTEPETDDFYHNSFSCIPAAGTFRPPRRTPKPTIQGSQTAIVTGPEGEEIWPDQYGRVKVQFFWDRIGNRDDETSCWVRCMQGSAGKGFGSMFIPRVGQEVVISYLEGDPDRPIVTGIVYNSDQTPHYKLPDDKTRSYIKTNSTPGGGGNNELRFEDKKGCEQIYTHAQRDVDVVIGNESRLNVGTNMHVTVGSEKEGVAQGNQTEAVFGNKHQKVHGEKQELILGTRYLTIGDGSKPAAVAEARKNLSLATSKKELAIEKFDKARMSLLQAQYPFTDRSILNVRRYYWRELTSNSESVEVIAARAVAIAMDATVSAATIQETHATTMVAIQEAQVADSTSVRGTKVESIEGVHHKKTLGRRELIDGDLSLETSDSKIERVGNNYTLRVGKMTIQATGGVAIKANYLCFSVGDSFISIDENKISIQAPLVDINGGGWHWPAYPVPDQKAPYNSVPAEPANPTPASG